MALVATPGASNANSYGTLIEADDYFLNHPSADTWDALVEQEEMLIHATRLLDQYDYIGSPATTTQALQWPRIINDLYETNHDEFPYAANVVPTKMKYAQFETAVWLAQTGGTVASGTVSELTIGKSVTAKFATGETVVDTSVDQSGLPIQAARFLKGLRLYSVLA